MAVAAGFPGCDFPDQGLLVGNAAIETVRRQSGWFSYCLA
jgi:hypothetical protein